MMTSFVRSRVGFLISVGALVALAACGGDKVGSSVLSKLPDKATRAQVMATIGTGQLKAFQPGDSLRLASGYRLQKFISKGLTHEVLWYRDSTGTTEAPITRDTDTPIVLVGDTLKGWGWRFYDKYSAEYDLPNPSKSKERLDSVSKSQMPKK